ncbi:hypothetical protein [Actinacidiphila glaucinigra]|uniref:Uncharacterized protein n=1 Tax=Actinacidiphila glaucinigra TaxID=235986 RepID=A0A239NP56_9ACTN|nr:hypothetical protein [Actinacidiphila glaucinigra]SNT56233.1 hypothetical protein SAMN05216252_14126 [Actinacidiphila glaucinigra]
MAHKKSLTAQLVQAYQEAKKAKAAEQKRLQQEDARRARAAEQEQLQKERAAAKEEREQAQRWATAQREKRRQDAERKRKAEQVERDRVCPSNGSVSHQVVTESHTSGERPEVLSCRPTRCSRGLG